jgi:hypothetical protein
VKIRYQNVRMYDMPRVNVTKDEVYVKIKIYTVLTFLNLPQTTDQPSSKRHKAYKGVNT